jgi:hypothetical protein
LGNLKLMWKCFNKFMLQITITIILLTTVIIVLIIIIIKCYKIEQNQDILLF